jgi:hypothetical protein
LQLQEYYECVDWEFQTFDASLKYIPLENYIFKNVKAYSFKDLETIKKIMDANPVFLLIGRARYEDIDFFMLLFAGEIHSVENLSSFFVLLKASNKVVHRALLQEMGLLTVYETIRKRLQRDKKQLGTEIIATNNYMNMTLKISFLASKVFSTYEQNSEKSVREVMQWDYTNGYGINKEVYTSRKKRKASKAVEIPENVLSSIKSTENKIDSKQFGLRSAKGKHNSKIVKLERKLFDEKSTKSIAHVISDFQVSRMSNVFKVPISFSEMFNAIKNISNDILKLDMSDIDSNSIIGAVSSKFFEDIGWHNTGPQPLLVDDEKVIMAVDLDQVTLEINDAHSIEQHTLQELYNLLITKVSD